MKMEWIKCFLAVSSTGSINQAAEVLYLSQPNVTKMIQALEKSMETSLFIRKKSGMELTEQGELFLPYAMEIMKTYRAYEKERATLLELEHNRHIDLLEIGCSTILFQAYHREISASLRNTLPNSSVKYIETDMRSLMALIQEKPNTVGLVGIPDNQLRTLPKGLELRKITETSIVACVNSTAGYRQGETVSPDSLPKKVITVNYYAYEEQYRPKSFEISSGNLDVINDMLTFNDDVFAYMPEAVARKTMNATHITMVKPETDTKLVIGLLYKRCDVSEECLPDWALEKLEEAMTKAFK